MDEHLEHDSNQYDQRWRSSASSTRSYQPVPTDDNRSQNFAVPRKPLPSRSQHRMPTADVSSEKLETESVARKDHGLFKIILISWWPELLASVVSILALVAIVVVLHVYDGHSIDELRLPSSLTLNGLIALIATFDRLFLVIPVGSVLSQEAWLWFAENHNRKNPKSRLRDLDRSDAASRGAWGSLLFISTSPYRLLSVAGCLIMIFSLAIPTFIQQLILQEDIPLAKDVGSILQPGNIPRSEYYFLHEGAPTQGPISPPLTMIAAIYNGLMTETVDTVPVYCPSGNCTWPLTPSLAVCGGCASIDPIKTSCESYFCNYTAPSGSVFQIANLTASGGELTAFQVMTSRGQHWNVSKGDRMYVANFDMMGVPYNTIGANISGGASPNLSASECALWMCVNTYDTYVRLGNQTQQVVSSFSEIAFDLHIDSENYTFSYPNTSSSVNDTHRTEFAVFDFAWSGLSNQFGASLAINGTIELTNRAHLASSDVVDAVWAGTVNQSKWIENIATSMSNVVRTNNPAPDSRYDGTAYVPGIHIDWWWISLPAATVAASIILLLTVIVRTTRSPVRSWRARPLNFLFSELDDDIKAAVTETESGKEIGPGVDKQVVTLTRNNEKFWIFTSHRDVSYKG